MRLTRFLLPALVLLMPAVSSAQGWSEYSSRADFRYPHLERIPGTRDHLTEILAARPVAAR